MNAKNVLTRVKVRRGLHLVKRGRMWYAETAEHGVQTRRSLDTEDLQEAQRRLAQGLTEPAPKPPPKPTNSYTLAQALTDYREWYTRNRRASGAERLFPVLDRFIDMVGAETETRAVTREHVQRFVDSRVDGRAGITVRNDFARVRAFLRWISSRKDAADWNATRGIEKPKDDETTREAPSVEKVRAVLQKLRAHPWLGDYCSVLAETGMRPAELLGVRGTDLRGKLLSIVPWSARELKSKWSKRTIEVNAAAQAILSRRVGTMFDKARPIFANADGGVYKEESAYHMFLRELGGGKPVSDALRMTLYDFRHFFCSEHAAPGPQHMEIEALAAYIGHSPKSRDTLLRWYTDQNALRRGAPAPLTQTGEQGRIAEMK